MIQASNKDPEQMKRNLEIAKKRITQWAEELNAGLTKEFLAAERRQLFMDEVHNAERYSTFLSANSLVRTYIETTGEQYE